MEGILEEEGEIPFDIEKVINTNKENKLTPMPRGEVREILSVSAAAYSSSVNLRLSCAPPSCSISFLSSTALSQAS